MQVFNVPATGAWSVTVVPDFGAGASEGAHEAEVGEAVEDGEGAGDEGATGEGNEGGEEEQPNEVDEVVCCEAPNVD